MSYMYSLLNYIAATSKDIFETSSVLAMNLGDVSDFSTLHSVETGLRGLTEDEKRTVGISTISVATRLALESKSDEVRSAPQVVLDRTLLACSSGYPSNGVNAAAADAIGRANCRGCYCIQSS